MTEPLRFRQTRFPSPEFLRQFFLLSDVHQSTDKPSKDSVFTDRHSNTADHPLHAVGPDNAFLEIASFTGLDHASDGCLHNFAILRMHPCEVVRNSWDSSLRIEAENL